MERSHLLLLLLLLLVVGVGILAPMVAGYEPGPCELLALHINRVPYPVTEKDRGGASCEVVRSGVDSSLAAAPGVTPCLCLLDDHIAFLVTGFFIRDIPAEIYAPCGGQHVKEAQLLADKCDGLWAPLPSPSEEEKDKHGGAVEVIGGNTHGLAGLAGSISIVE